MLVFMCRDPGDTTSKVSFCAETSYCFKYRDIDASDRVPLYPIEISLPENKTSVNLKSASSFVIMHLREGLTHLQSQIKPWLLFGESFTLIYCHHGFPPPSPIIEESAFWLITPIYFITHSKTLYPRVH